MLVVRYPDPSNHVGPEVLIKWKNLPKFEASWEPAELIKSQFPDFHLEDKVSLEPGGNVRPPIRYTYTRRKKMRVDQGNSVIDSC